MRFNEINKPKLTEAVSSVLFHATTFSTAESILRNDFIKGNDGISFTRSLQGAYHKKNKMIGVIFEFDGNKLNQKYKGGPVGTENFNYDPEDYDPDDEYTWSHHGRSNAQLEDRIHANRIDNVTAYIKSAIMYLPAEYVDARNEDEFGDSYGQISHVENVANLLNQHNIPVRYITSEKDLTNPRANDKEGFRKLILKMQGEEEEEYVIKYSIYRGQGEHEPNFDEIKIKFITTDMDLAIKYAEKVIPAVAKKTKSDTEYVDIVAIQNTATGDTFEF